MTFADRHYIASAATASHHCQVRFGLSATPRYRVKYATRATLQANFTLRARRISRVLADREKRACQADY